jgi:predicted Holliday junction resolvase-like endonuclease
MGYIFLGIIVAILVIILVVNLCHSKKLKDEIEENKHTYFAERKILHDQLEQQEKTQCVT